MWDFDEVDDPWENWDPFNLHSPSYEEPPKEEEPPLQVEDLISSINSKKD